MIIPCFRRQIQTLFSLGAYRATGTLLPCTCQLYESEHAVGGKLTYKIDIAHRLYGYYEQESFKYAEKGVTPRMIAEETAIYTHESPHLTLEIDSFGYLLVSPSDLYLRELRENLLRTRKVSHYPIEMKYLRWKDITFKPQGVILSLADLSLTSLRVAFTLDLICRKKVLMGECSPEAISRLIDVSQLTEFQVQELLESKLFGIKGLNTQVKTGKPLQLNSAGAKIVKEFQPASPGEWLGGCERHYTIPFFKQYRHLLEEEDQLLKFGSIFPNISLSQLKQLSQQRFRQEYWKLMRYSLGFDPHMPINLKEPLPLPAFQTSLGKMMGNRSGMEQVLMVLDQLGNNEVGQCYYWMISRSRFQGDKGQEEVWALLRDLLSLLVEPDD